jgi:hypothetical protein
MRSFYITNINNKNKNFNHDDNVFYQSDIKHSANKHILAVPSFKRNKDADKEFMEMLANMGHRNNV